MSAYRDYVLTKTEEGNMGLYSTNAWSHLENGDLVLIELGNAVEVVAALTLSPESDSEVIDFIMSAMGVDDTPKLYGKVKIMKFEEEEEEE